MTGAGGRGSGGGGAEAAVRLDAPSGPEPSEALQRLRRGEIDVEAYLDIKVEQSTRHLQKLLPPEQLDVVKETLREQLASDPVLLGYLERLRVSPSADSR